MADEPLFIIEPVMTTHRVLFADGHVLDVSCANGFNSTERGAALIEAHRRWGGKQDIWTIVGATALPGEAVDG